MVPELSPSNETSTELYCLAEKYCFVNLMDQTLDSIIECRRKSGTRFSASGIATIYENIHENSKLRLLCAAEISCVIGREGIQGKEKLEEYSELFKEYPEFFYHLFEFQAKYARLIPNTRKCHSEIAVSVSGFNFCELHIHCSKVPCYKKIGVSGTHSSDMILIAEFADRLTW